MSFNTGLCKFQGNEPLMVTFQRVTVPKRYRAEEQGEKLKIMLWSVCH